MKLRLIQIAISVAAVMVAIAHIVWPQAAIDLITVTLLIIAVAPWLAPLLKSLHLPGGVVLEFDDEFFKAAQRVEAQGLLSGDVKMADKSDQTEAFETFDNPRLTVASLRIEIEKRLRQMEKVPGGERRGSVASKIIAMSKAGALTSGEATALRSLIKTLDRALDGVDVDSDVAEWAASIAPALLSTLANRLEKLKAETQAGVE